MQQVKVALYVSCFAAVENLCVLDESMPQGKGEGNTADYRKSPVIKYRIKSWK